MDVFYAKLGEHGSAEEVSAALVEIFWCVSFVLLSYSWPSARRPWVMLGAPEMDCALAAACPASALIANTGLRLRFMCYLALAAHWQPIFMHVPWDPADR